MQDIIEKSEEITIDRLEGLNRRVKIVLTPEKLEQKAHAQLQKMAGQVKLKGFRQNKVPFSEVKKRFAVSVYQEVAIEEMKSRLNEILQKEKMFPATTPNIQIESIHMGHPLEFVAEFEEYPVINLVDFKTLQVEKIATTVSDEQVDKFVTELQKQNAKWEEVPRAAALGDTIVIDFTGTIDGKEFSGGSAKGVRVELGKGMMLPDFEKQLIGAAAGQTITFVLTFPENYHKDLSGKQAEFTTTVLNVLEAKIPDLDAALLEKLGFKEGGLEALRAQIKKSVEGQVANIIQQKTKLQVINLLTEKHEILLPKVMVDQEMQRLANGQDHEHDEHCNHDHDPKETPDLHTAQRNVKQALLLREIMKVSGLKVDANRVRQHILKLVQPGQNPDQVLAWFYQDKQRYGNIEAAILEEQIVEKVLEQAQLIEKAVSYEEAIKGV